MNEVHKASDWDSATLVSEGDLAALVASRICHDITSPLGAIANGVELLTLSGLERSPEMDLIFESVESANARIRFFRLAFGASGQQPIGRAEVVRTLAALSRSGRLKYDWVASGDYPRNEIKAVFLLLQCLESAMPMGGSIRVLREADEWRILAEGPRLKVDLPAFDSLRPGYAPPPDGPAYVQFVLLSGVLNNLGRRIDVSLAPDRIEAQF